MLEEENNLEIVELIALRKGSERRGRINGSDSGPVERWHSAASLDLQPPHFAVPVDPENDFRSLFFLSLLWYRYIYLVSERFV